MALPLLRPIFGNIISGISGNNLLTQDLSMLGIMPPQWGLFNEGGDPVIIADSVTAVEYKEEYTISDYPLEKGAFETYDKVSAPFMARMTFVTGGSFANRQAFLQSIAAIAGDLKKYTMVTPEVSYANVNITHYDYRRTAAHGMGLMEVIVWVQQIREDVQTQLSDSQEPSGAGTESGGQVQGTPVDDPSQHTSILYDISKKIMPPADAPPVTSEEILKGIQAPPTPAVPPGVGPG